VQKKSKKDVPGASGKTPEAMDDKMQAPTLLEPPPKFADPRLHRDFDSDAWPSCNGNCAPLPGSTDLYERRCLEFLAAYYRLNRLNRSLLVSRQNSEPKKKVRSIVSRINAATVALEKLEDRYAPIGFFGEPVMDGVFYRDIVFVRPELPRVYPPLQSSHIAIPGLEQIPQSELRGPVKIIRFGREKVDL
jgi:hypothetical protein